MEEFLRIPRFDEFPSAEEFTSRIEPRNVPAVFRGCVKDWKALKKWNPSNGGLDYLQELVGSSVVEAMLSRSAPHFYGDIRSHETVEVLFSDFIGYCKSILQNKYGDQEYCLGSSNNGSARSASEQNSSLIGEEDMKQIYLAQVPIMNIEKEEKVQLECLREDIQTPALLESKTISSINLWMGSAQTRSSTHYDPHHNLLCIVAGCKQVVLWPPSATPFLYPLPIYGEASNHSAVTLEKPDLCVYPRAEHLNQYSQTVTLQAGDAVFIPEGWFHQVDSDSLTIAVNFWWRSDVVSGMPEHMDSYYLRRILRRLIEKEMNQVLPKLPMVVNELVIDRGDQPNTENADNCDRGSEPNFPSVNLKGNELTQKFMLHDLEPLALHSLHELASLVHGCVDKSQPADTTYANQSIRGKEDESKKNVTANLFNLEEDPIANVIWTLPPLTFTSVFLSMAHNFPRTLEALVLHALSPVGAEVLTRKLEEMDQMLAKEDRNLFYSKFYSVFDNQFSAMDALLNRKELFANKAGGFAFTLHPLCGDSRAFLERSMPCIVISIRLGIEIKADEMWSDIYGFGRKNKKNKRLRGTEFQKAPLWKKKT